LFVDRKGGAQHCPAMKIIHTKCPKCQQPIQVDAPGRGLFLPIVAAALVGAVIGIAVFASVPRRAPAQKAWVAPGKAQELVDALPSVNLQELAQGTAMRSTSGGIKSMVVFNNKTAAPLQRFWIDYNGQRKKYGDMAPFSSQTQATYATHPWLMVDNNDNPVALFVSLPGNCVANITSLPAAK
jgi:hypothetical protein